MWSDSDSEEEEWKKMKLNDKLGINRNYYRQYVGEGRGCQKVKKEEE